MLRGCSIENLNKKYEKTYIAQGHLVKVMWGRKARRMSDTGKSVLWRRQTGKTDGEDKYYFFFWIESFDFFTAIRSFDEK